MLESMAKKYLATGEGNKVNWTNEEIKALQSTEFKTLLVNKIQELRK